MDIKTQEEKILKWLERGRKLTALKALELFGCFRLSARIKDLKKKGHAINSRIIKTRYGKRVAEYSL